MHPISKKINFLSCSLPRICMLLLLVSLLHTGAFAQTATQTIRGIITDQQSKAPVPDAVVSLPELNLGAIADAAGAFVIPNVPVGRVRLLVAMMGYETQSLPDVVLESGKETVLHIELLEQVLSRQEVVVRAKRMNITEQNQATVSATVFNAEDTRRFAGSRNDVARMAANFAGASTNNDGRNDIVIRGNSPAGLLWRIEGVDVPNPNHFGDLGATGGPVSMINNNLLGKSAFYTSAFPAMYGNASSGVFDLQLREGNNQRREYTGQMGFTGFELGAEGYFVKDKKASYLLNYRYSVPGLLKAIGLNSGTGEAVPYYQDVSFKIVLPTAKAGKFSLFGIGGISHIDFKGNLKDTANFYNDPYSNLFFKTKTGILGLSHTYFFNQNTSSKITLATTGSQSATQQDSLNELRLAFPGYRQAAGEWKYVLSVVLNKKFSAKDRAIAGFTVNDLHYAYADSLRRQGVLQPILSEQGSSQLLQAYVQWQHRFNNRLTLNTGVYSQFLTLNNKYAVESRVGARYATGSGHLTLAYGMHSQMQPLRTYFLETRTGNNYIQTNRDLDFTRSNHFVAGWQQTLFSDWHYKLEAYYQMLYKVPVTEAPSAYSMLNSGADYYDAHHDSLVNKGTGTNYGLELTVEKPFSNSYYILTTASLFQSRYKGSDGVSHNTAFNGNYVLNVLGGKEWKLGSKSTFGLDLKLTAAGGKRYTPVNLEESQEEHTAVYENSQAFEKKLKDYFRSDVKLTYRRNGRRVMQEFFIDFQNVTNNKNVFRQAYDARSGVIRTQNQLGFTPNFNYRIQF